MTVLPFLTAWDPTDLPGASVDPLGFDRSYNWLADQLLPSLTNVASQPRYFSLLCAGASLGPTPEAPTPTRREIVARQEVVLRLERLWALGHALLETEVAGTSSGIRGVTYAHSHLQELERKKSRSTTTKFKLLLSQGRYGVLGIYGNVASGLRLTERGTLGLTPDFGERLGKVFLESSDTPASVRRAALDESEKTEVGLNDLAEWVRRSGVNASMADEEFKLLAGAVNEHERRRRVGYYLEKVRWKVNKETELEYLHRLEDKLSTQDDDLRDLARAVRLFELCYRTATLVLERLLWRCGQEASVTLKSLTRDDVLKKTAEAFPFAIKEFLDHADGAASGAVQPGAERMMDLRRFLSDAAEASGDVGKMVEVTVKRHAEVQAGKFVRGRAKLPWLEVLDGRLQLTLAQSNQVNGEPTEAPDIAPHEYRLRTARALLFGNEARE